MEAKELRIGNLIEYFYPHEEEWGTLSVSIEDLEDVHKESFRPIPLTEDWLLKMGFSNQNFYWSCIDENFEIAELKNNEWIHSINGCEYTDGKTFKYVHQLQNLYFALTNTELTINL